MSSLKEKIDALNVKQGTLAVIFMGQAGFILKDSQNKLYSIDVYFSDCCEREFGFKRLIPKLLEPKELVFDYILVTHGHYDHFDLDAMPTLMDNDKTTLYGPKDAIQECEKLSINERTVEIAENDSFKVGNLNVKAVYCDHGELAPYAVGYVIEHGGKKIYLVGDSAYQPEKIAYLKNENVDLMFVPINGAFGNLNEQEAVKYVQLISPEMAVPCHYGNFKEHGGDVNKFNSLFSKETQNTKNLNLKIGDIFVLE